MTLSLHVTQGTLSGVSDEMFEEQLQHVLNVLEKKKK